jgi:hypothetical protein
MKLNPELYFDQGRLLKADISIYTKYSNEMFSDFWVKMKRFEQSFE